MASRALPNLGLINRWVAGQNGYGVDIDGDFQKLDTLLFLVVKSASSAAPPISPTQGDRYIVAASATGAWAGQDQKIAVWIDGAWVFYNASLGWQAEVADDSYSTYRYGGSVWTRKTQPYDFQSFRYNVPAAPEPVFSLIVPRPTVLPVNLAGSYASLMIAATASQVFTIKQNTTTIGTITFASGVTTGTFSFTSAITLAAGDILEVDPPASLNSVLRGLRLALVATR